MSKFEPESCVWEYFEINNDKKANCNFCEKSISSTPVRMKKHILKGCDKTSEMVKLIVIKENTCLKSMLIFLRIDLFSNFLKLS